jgi:chorismate synthase
MLLNKFGILVAAYVQSIGTIHLDKNYPSIDLSLTEDSPVRCPDPDISREMIRLIEKTKAAGDTLGGKISCVIQNVPAGLGEPVFDKLHADLGKAILGINAVKGFEIGSGFSGSEMTGLQHNDKFIREEGMIKTTTNFSGGIQGGISNGSDIFFTAAFKPVATLMQDQVSVDKEGQEIVIEGKGRHDVTVLPRAVPIVEAMAALVIADHLLQNMVSKID